MTLKNDGKWCENMGNRWEHVGISAAKNGDWWGSKKKGDLSRETWESTAPGFCCLGSAPWPKQSMLARRLPGITRDALRRIQWITPRQQTCETAQQVIYSDLIIENLDLSSDKGDLSSETWQLWIPPWKHRFELVIYWDLTFKKLDFTRINRD